MTPPTLPYAPSSEPPRFARFLLRPLGWPFYIAQILLFLLIFYLARLPGSLAPLIAAVYLGGFLAFVFVVRLLLQITLWFIYKKPWPQFWPTLPRYAYALIAPLLLAILLAFDAPFQLAFAISKSALEREALAAKVAYVPPATSPFTAPVTPFTPRTAGLFTIQSMEYDPSQDVVKILFDGAGFLNQEGVAYSKNPHLSPTGHSETYHPLSWPWYRYKMIF